MTGLKVRRLLARMDVVVPGRVLDDNDVVLVEYEGGATGVYWTSQFAIGHDNDLRVRIYGEKGSILWRQEECETVIMIDEDGTLVERHRGGGGIEPGAAAYGRLPAGHTEGWLESMGNLYRSFVRCLQAKADGTLPSIWWISPPWLTASRASGLSTPVWNPTAAATSGWNCNTPN